MSCRSYPSALLCSLVRTESRSQSELRLLLIYRNPDEYCTARVVLRLSNCSEASLKQHLQHLEVRLDTFAIDPSESVAENPTPTRDLIFSGAVSGKEEDPLVVFNEFEGDTERGNHVYVIWNIPVFLSKDISGLIAWNAR